MIRWLLRVYEPYLTHLEAEVEYWRRLYEHERRRAEQAVDMLLLTKGAPVVTPAPERRSPEADLVKEFIDATSSVGAIE